VVLAGLDAKHRTLLSAWALGGGALGLLLGGWTQAAPWARRQVAALAAMVPFLMGLVMLLAYGAGIHQLYAPDHSLFDPTHVPMSLPAAVCALGLGSCLQLALGREVFPLALLPDLALEVHRQARTRLWLGSLAGLILLGSGVALIWVRQGSVQAGQTIQRGLLAVADLRAKEVSDWYEERLLDTSMLERDGLIQTRLVQCLEQPLGRPAPRDLEIWLEDLLRQGYHWVVLLDAQGRVRAQVPAGLIKGLGDLDAGFFQTVLHSRGLQTLGLHRDKGLQESHLGLGVPVGPSPAGGAAKGVLLLMVDPRAQIYPLLAAWPVPSATAETVLIRPEGDGFRFLSDPRGKPGAALTLTVPPANAARLRRALAEGGAIHPMDFRGVPVVAVVRPVPGTGTLLVAKMDQEEAFAPQRLHIYRGILTTLGLLGLILMLLGLVLRLREQIQDRKRLALAQRLDWLMRGANDIILVVDDQGRILDANRQAEATYGYQDAEWLALTVFDLRDDAQVEDASRQFAEVKAHGSIRFETCHRRKDGTSFPVEVSSSSGLLGDEQLVISFVRDISDRKAQEQALQRMTRLYAALSQVNQAIVLSHDRQTMLEKICAVMVNEGPFNMAWVAWDDPDTHCLSVAARCGDVTGMLDRVSVRSDDTPEGRGAVGSAIREARPVIIQDFLTECGSAPWREELTHAGFTSIAALPIREAGLVRGALVVYAAEKGVFGVQEVALLEEAAIDISYALDHLDEAERRQQAELALMESERFLRAAQEAGGIGTYEWNIPEDRWKSSPYLDRIFGIGETYPRTLQSWADLVDPSFQDRVHAYVAGIIERHERFDLEYPIIRVADGASRWVRGTGEIQWDEAGNPLSMSGVTRDITERRTAEASLRASEEKFSRAFHASPDSVNITRLSDGVYVAVNSGFTRTTGYTEEEALGHSSLPGGLDLWVHPEDRLKLKERLQRDGLVKGLEAEFRCKDGTVITGLMSASLIEVEGEACVLSITRDITESRAQARQIERLAEVYAALSQVNQAIVMSTSRQELMEKVCEVMVTFGKFKMAWIGWDDPGTHQVSVMAHYGDDHGYLEGIQVRSDDTPAGQGPTGQAIRTNAPCLQNDLFAQPSFMPWRAAALRSGFASMAAFPIRQGGFAVGALMIYAAEAQFFGSQEITLLEEAAGDISFSLDLKALEAEREEAITALRESQSRFQMLADTTAGAIFVFRGDHFVYANPAFCTLSGYTLEEIQAQPFWSLVYAEDQALVRDRGQARQRGESVSSRYDFRIVRKDGSVRWMDFTAGRISWDGLPAAVGTAYDITDRKAMEESLRIVYRAMEQSPVSVMITDASGRIEYVNPALTKVTGYRVEELLGRNPRILKSGHHPPEFYRDMWDTLITGQVWSGEIQNRRKDGGTLIEWATISPNLDEDGRITSFVAIKEDITEAKRAEEQRRQLEVQLQQSQKLESLGSLAGGVAHDMNNVLGAILGLATSLQEKVDPGDTAAKSLQTIVNACLRGRGVVKSLLYFAHKGLVEERPVDLNALVQDMTQLLSHTTLQRIRLEVDLTPGLGLVRCDPGALSHALMNLCVNAVDAMPGGGALCLATAALPDGSVEVRVKDTGEGMPPEVLAKAMEPFFTTKPRGKGTGLGLSMAYATMKAHQGSLDLRSEPGQGTEAILLFPAERVEQASSDAETVSVATEASASALTILLVDDDSLLRESVAEVLEMLGHHPIPVAGGSEALDALKNGLVLDLVILDMNMPGMTGAQALPQILALRPGLPVIMSTGYSDEDIADLLRQHPTVHSLRKPFTMKELAAKLASLKAP
jgi:PAS domain S-box-containing protein